VEVEVQHEKDVEYAKVMCEKLEKVQKIIALRDLISLS